MSAIRTKLVQRLTKASSQSKGVLITPGYSPTWKNEAKRLVDEKVAKFRGGKLFLAKKG